MKPTGLPDLDVASQAHLHDVEHHLRQQIAATEQGFMPFDSWMDLALYAPGLGYYAAGNTKFGGGLPTGDFTTAPELTPVFGQTLANVVAHVLRASDSTTVLEFGAGTGALAAAVIPALRRQGIEPRYRILEVSADLQARQKDRLAALDADVEWLTALPQNFRGCVLANEVLDAMPVTLFRWDDDGNLLEVGVGLAPEADGAQSASAEEAAHFRFAARNAASGLKDKVEQRMPPLPGYQSEINLRAESWVKEMGQWLTQGAALLIDYGFPQREYYHPQRKEGTLMCHFRHHAHAQPLVYPGLQDITAHVDFTAMADAALDGGLDVLGYTSQARFLVNAGIADVLAAAGAGDESGTSKDQGAGTTPAGSTLADAAERQGAATLSAVQKLLSEAEMGELFKVLAIGRGVDAPLMGFQRGDRRDRL
ncbi:class I SAM-dependent methyltransferase [Parapusillimonas sp. SGNA-6]|nr:class I SAM-dependent methyltransferase [Parapusillimonas sp. SGNA-6]